MPRKKTLPPKEIHVVELPDGEFKPLFVAARDIGKVVIGLSPKTMANWRAARVGPSFTVVNGTPYYSLEKLQLFFSRNPVQTVDRRDK